MSGTLSISATDLYFDADEEDPVQDPKVWDTVGDLLSLWGAVVDSVVDR